jgi:hypothetical protein
MINYSQELIIVIGVGGDDGHMWRRICVDRILDES